MAEHKKEAECRKECERKSNVAPQTWQKEFEGTPFYYGLPKPIVFINGKKIMPKKNK